VRCSQARGARRAARGAELEAEIKPIDHVTLGLAAGYTNAKFTQTVMGGQGAILVANGDGLGGPPLTYTLSSQLDFPWAMRNVYARAEYSCRYVTVRVGMRSGGLNVSLFADNVTRAEPNSSRYHLFSLSLLYTDVSFRPLTMGVTAVYKF
jgi:iron complex outermembrane recepter protein